MEVVKLSSPSHEEVFSKIYADGLWGSNGTPKSGSGSIPAAAAPYVDLISSFLTTHEIKSLLDIGHGDWSMWKEYKFEGISYTGIDVFAGASKLLSEEYGNENRKFLAINAVTECLPKAQICTSKDVLQHLPNSDVQAILEKCNKFEYMIVCNDFYKFRLIDSVSALRRFISIRERIVAIKHKENPFYLKLKRTNSNISIGEHRAINLQKNPFRKFTEDFSLIGKIDFDGSLSRRPNLIKRIYIFKIR
jgi:hypothetical protein